MDAAAAAATAAATVTVFCRNCFGWRIRQNTLHTNGLCYEINKQTNTCPGHTHTHTDKTKTEERTENVIPVSWCKMWHPRNRMKNGGTPWHAIPLTQCKMADYDSLFPLSWFSPFFLPFAIATSWLVSLVAWAAAKKKTHSSIRLLEWCVKCVCVCFAHQTLTAWEMLDYLSNGLPLRTDTHMHDSLHAIHWSHKL